MVQLGLGGQEFSLMPVLRMNQHVSKQSPGTYPKRHTRLYKYFKTVPALFHYQFPISTGGFIDKHVIAVERDTLPETNIFAPGNGWLGDDRLHLEWPIFRCEPLVLGKVHSMKLT